MQVVNKVKESEDKEDEKYRRKLRPKEYTVIGKGRKREVKSIQNNLNILIPNSISWRITFMHTYAISNTNLTRKKICTKQ